MSSQDFGQGGNLGGISQQQIAELMKTLGTSSADTTEEVKAKTRLPHEKDTTEKSAEKAVVQKKTDSGKPVLFPPVTKAMTSKGTKEFIAQEAQKETEGTSAPKTADPKEKGQIYAKENPGVKFLQKLTGGDEAKVIALLDQALKEEGVSPPVKAGNPKLPGAIQKAIAQILKDKKIPLAESKAQIWGKTLQTIKVTSDYSALLQNIDPTGKTHIAGEGLQKANGVYNSAQELVNATMAQIQKSKTIPANQKTGIMEYLQAIGKLIGELQQVLIQLKLKDTDTSKKLDRQIVQNTQRKMKYILKKFQETFKKLKLQGSIKYVQKVMKIFNYVMSAVGVVAALVILPFCPVIGIVLLAAAVTQLVMSTAFMKQENKLFKHLNKVIGNVGKAIFKGLGINLSPDTMAKISQVIFWTTTMTLLTVGMMLFSLVPVIGMAVPLALMPIVMTMLTDSKVLETIMQGLQSVTGMSKRLQTILSLVLSLAVSLGISIAVELFGVLGNAVEELISGIFTGGGSLIMGALNAAADQVGALRSIMNAVKFVVKTIRLVINKVVKFVKRLMEELKSIVKKSASAITSAAKKVLEVVQEVITKLITTIPKLDQYLERLKETINPNIYEKIKDKVEQLREQLSKTRERVEKIVPIVSGALQTIAQVGPSGANAIAQLDLGLIAEEMSKITKKQGETQKMIMIIDEIIKLLEGFVSELQGGSSHMGGGAKEGDVGEFMKQVDSLGQLFKKIVSSMTGITDQVVSSAAA